MATIPTYKREQLRVPDAIARQGGAAAKAEAQGQAGVANAYGNLAQGHAQTANIESAGQRMQINNLSNRLNDFNQQLNDFMGKTATKVAVDSANKHFMDNKAQIQKIRNDTSLDPIQQQEQIAKIETKLTGDYMSVYGRAYDTTAEANYNNQIVITAAQRAQEASEASGDDGEKFKTTFKKYSEDAVSNAPSDATRLVAGRAFDKAGLSTYKRMYNAQKAKQDKEGKATSSIASGHLLDGYVNASTRGDVSGAAEYKTAYVANRNAAAQAGYTTVAQAMDDVNQLDPIAQQSNIINIFEESHAEGAGVSVLQETQALWDSGQLDLWKPGVASKIIRGMEATINDRADFLADDVTSLLKSGKQASFAKMEELKTYQPYLSTTKMRALNTANAEFQMLEQLNGMPLQEQLTMLDEQMSAKEQDPLVYDALSGARDTVQKKLLAAKADPITLGAQDDRYNLQTLDPTALNVQEVQTRYTQSTIAKDWYKTQRKFFTNAEVETFVAHVESPMVSIDNKLKLISTIEAGTKGKSDAAFNQIAKKGAAVFAGAASMVQEGKTLVAKHILEGNMFLKEKAVATNKQELGEVISAELGNFLAYMGQGDGERITKTVESLSAYYALKAGTEASGEIESDHIERAIVDVLGESGEYNDHTFFAPTGVDPDDVEDYFDDLEPSALAPIFGVLPGEEANAIQRSHIIHNGGGEYVFIYDGTFLFNEDQTVYTIRYTK